MSKYILETVKKENQTNGDFIDFMLIFRGHSDSDKDLLEQKRKISKHHFTFKLDGLYDKIEKYTEEYNDEEIYKMCIDYLNKIDEGLFKQSLIECNIIMDKNFFEENKKVFWKSHEYLRNIDSQKKEKVIFDFFNTVEI